MKIFREGVPLAGHFPSKRRDFEARLQYDNHPPLVANLEATRKKFGQEEAKSFHIAFPRFVARFLSGAMISPISWVVQKGKGRFVADASTTLYAKDTEDILQHTDDIDADFRRILYHPDVAIVSGYVVMEFVIVPVGEYLRGKKLSFILVCTR